MIAPWIIHEAEIALFPAWKDGMPFRGPGLPRGVPSPVFQCKASLSISEARRSAAVTGHSWTGAQAKAESEWDIGVSFPDGIYGDTVSRVMSRVPTGGFHILVIRFLDARRGEWSSFTWFFVTVENDDAADSAQVMNRSVKLKSTWMQEGVGSATVPSLVPAIRGEVDWVCGSQRITGLSYDPVAEIWTSLPRNETGDGSRYVNLSPMVEDGPDIALAAYFPRVVPGVQPAPALPTARIAWQNLVLARIGNVDSEYHHGLALLGGLLMQTSGIPEPLLTDPQDRMLDEPVIVFRYLRRIYAVLGHGVWAVPRLTLNEAPPFSHDPPFRLAIPGDSNPATGQNGLTLLPDGAWLDGTVQSF